MPTGLDAFHAHLKEVARLAAWVLPTAGISPIVASLVGLNPPWPNVTGLTVATSAAVLFTVMAVFQLLNSRDRALVGKAMLASLWIGATFFIIYLALLGLFVFEAESGDRIVKGFRCSVEAAQLYPTKCPWLGVDELKAATYEESRLWTHTSIAAVRVLLLLCWLCVFIAFSTCMGAFVRHQAQTASKPRRPSSRG